jgi:hypothetical protein
MSAMSETEYSWELCVCSAGDLGTGNHSAINDQKANTDFGLPSVSSGGQAGLQGGSGPDCRRRLDAYA